jgi:hypothetical protein
MIPNPATPKLNALLEFIREAQNEDLAGLKAAVVADLEQSGSE